MIIKNILNKIYIHPSCYFVLLLSIFSANFKIMTLVSLLLLVHECGHFFTACIFKWPTLKISFYPFGGISKFSHDINCPLKEEILVLIMGPVSQVLFYLLLMKINYFNQYKQIVSLIHYNILFFNLLPIYPLDGGRLVQCFICFFTSYNLSFKLIYLISYLFLFLFMIIFIFTPSFNLLLIILLLIIKLIGEYRNIKYYLERFILERYLHKYKFKKSTIVNSDRSFKRDYYHLVKMGRKYQLEDEYLDNKYK